MLGGGAKALICFLITLAIIAPAAFKSIMAVIVSVLILVVLVFVILFFLKKFNQSGKLPKTTTDDAQPVAGRALTVPQTTPPKLPVADGEFSLAQLSTVEWHRLEEVVAAYFRFLGYDARLTHLGTDGGVDVELWSSASLDGIVQIKAWNQPVGVAKVRELYGVLAARNIGRAYFFTTSSFTGDAMRFVRDTGDRLCLYDGANTVALFNQLADSQRRELHALTFADGFDIPSCPGCGEKMARRSGAYGEFWGCRAYPRCRGKLKIRGQNHD